MGKEIKNHKFTQEETVRLLATVQKAQKDREYFIKSGIKCARCYHSYRSCICHEGFVDARKIIAELKEPAISRLLQVIARKGEK